MRTAPSLVSAWGSGGQPLRSGPKPAPPTPCPYPGSRRRPPTGGRAEGSAPAHAPGAARCRPARGPWRCEPSPREPEPLRVHQQVALSAADLLAAVVAPLLPAYPRRLRRLGVYDAGGGGV